MTEKMFATLAVTVRGFKWCKDESRDVGLASLTAKVLCKHHNSQLSPVDDEGIKAFKAFRELARLSEVRQKMRPRRWNVLRSKLDGCLMERWFLKTLINMCVGADECIGPSSEVGRPNDELVRVAYGLSRFRGGAGVYGAGYVGQNIRCAEELYINVIIKNAAVIYGGLFQFRGFGFLLFLDEAGPPQAIHQLTLGGLDWSKMDFHFHQSNIHMDIGGYRSQEIVMAWD